MAFQTGTGVALLGTAALTLPSLFSVYHRNLNLPTPPLSPQFIHDNLHFTYRAKPQFQVLTPLWTIFTHMFHHVDIGHWLGNIYAMFQSGLTLDLGFTRTTILLIGGAISGALAHIFEWTLLTPFLTTISDLFHPTPPSQIPQPTLLEDLATDATETATSLFHWITTKITPAPSSPTSPQPPAPKLPTRTLTRLTSLLPLTLSLTGLSSATYALTGADLAQTLLQVRLARHHVRTATSPADRARKIEIYHYHLREAGGRSVVVLAQVVALLEPDLRGLVFDLGSGKWGGEVVGSGGGGGRPKEMVGHSAHLGGFLFGAGMMWWFGWGVEEAFVEDGEEGEKGW
ncbi:hypothetical protein HDV00_002424 [Rhizophlyctis rosea]|nr:hypothetical protein HDV00_002424 [Rhizophlyctis rosea]